MLRRMISKNFFTIVFTITMFVFAFAAGGCKKSNPHGNSDVAVTNSYLGCAVQDILGPETPVLRLSEPGMCPGHFDIRPSQVAALRNCRVLLRFDFQKSLDLRLGGIDKLKIAEIYVPGGLGLPSSYLAACSQVADALIAEGIISRENADRRLGEISQRMGQLESQTRKKLAGLNGGGLSAICSVHQEKFCRWLGLDVVATFRAADIQSVSDLNNAICAGKNSGVKFIIANFPEGRKAADALGGRLGVRVVVFGNFPAAGKNFDDLLTANVRKLMEASGL